MAQYKKASEVSGLEFQDSVTLSKASGSKASDIGGLKKAGVAVALGAALLGVFGLGALAAGPAQAQSPKTNVEVAKPVSVVQADTNLVELGQVPADSVETQFEQAGRELRRTGVELGRQGKAIGDQVLEDTAPLRKEAVELGKEIRDEATEVGKEIGQKGKEFGQGVGKAAKGFWRGLTGKN
jgi:hypothetical protein